jgi:hypothetical protein
MSGFFINKLIIWFSTFFTKFCVLLLYLLLLDLVLIIV